MTRRGLTPGVEATALQSAHVAIALAGACARLLSTLPATVASEIRAHLVVTEASLRALDDDVLELFTKYTEGAKAGSSPAAESCPSPTVQTANGDSGSVIAGHAVRGVTQGCGSGASVIAAGVACHDQAIPPFAVWTVGECPGHPAGAFDPMGETVYCDGSCARPRAARPSGSAGG